VLIPRDETEIMVNEVIREINSIFLEKKESIILIDI
jgi:hypothetical protein